MASYLDAKAHGGKWLLRIEDIDQARSRQDAGEQIIADLSRLGFRFEPNPWYQSQRLERYQAAFEKLQSLKRTYACVCSRKEIADSQGQNFESHQRQASSDAQTTAPNVYPGTCRKLLASNAAPTTQAIRAWRLIVEPEVVEWTEGAWLKGSHVHHREQITQTVGDFVIAKPASISNASKAETYEWTYQLSVVVDDEEAGVTHVVRGTDLLESTSRQIYLQSVLGFRRLNYWHCPLVLQPNGQKLSKQNGAQAINTENVLGTLLQALIDTGIPDVDHSSMVKLNTQQFWARAVLLWREKMLSAI
jgi:glutamyl-Q tRNA(Asp) synthetase